MRREQIYLATIDPQAQVTARKYGLGIEISEFCTAYNLDEQLDQVWPQVEEKLGYAERFVLHAPFNELFPCAIDPKARQLAKTRYVQAMEMAGKCGAHKVVIHGGFHPWIYYPVWYIEQSSLFWKDFAKEIPDGMTVCLENVLEPEPGYLLDIVKAVDSPKIRLCLDVGHGNAYSKIPVMEWLERWAPYLSHFHIHNNHGDFDTHQSLWDGTMDLVQFLTRADALCPDASFTLELMEGESSVKWLEEHGLI